MRSLLAAFLIAMLAEDYVPPPVSSEIEVAPKVFAKVTRWDWTADDPKNSDRSESTRLRIEHGGRVVEWHGSEIPIVLRADGESLFLIGFDREKCVELKDFRYRFNYYRSHDGVFGAIAADEFPKKLATQNMWLVDRETEVAVRNLDTSSMAFRLSPNAGIWLHLMKGELAQAGVDKAVLDEFKEKFRPEALPILQRKIEK